MGIQFDAEFSASDRTDAPSVHPILCRNLQHAGKRSGARRDNGARACFSEQGEFGGKLGFKSDFGAEAVACKTTFGERNRQTAIAQIVRGLDGAFGGEDRKSVV